jgi:transmembrane sensor
MQRISELIIKHLQNDLGEMEHHELYAWINQSPKNLELFSEITDQQTLMLDLTRMEDSRQRVIARLEESIPALKAQPVQRMIWRPLAAAAVLILVSMLYLVLHRSSKPEIARNGDSSQPIKKDVPAPTGTKTILTMADGSTIALDSVGSGNLGQQGNVKIAKLNNGQIVYNKVNEKPAEVLYNTLSTAKGGQTRIVLADGSKVWLNAASSLHFPAVFSGAIRKVELTGEAYFEIAHNKSMPFIVQVKEASIKVLGTQFNIMAYENEGALKTTLLEGSVIVSTGKQSSHLQPGQQAQISTGSEENIRINKDVDTIQVTAWKNGEFQFSVADIGEVMRQLERWYDIDIAYEGDKPAIRLSGSINRHVSLSSVLKLLELNGVHYKFDGKKLTVLK